MIKQQVISKENIKQYMLEQIQVLKESAKGLGLKFLCSYLELAEQVLDEELAKK